MANEELTEEQWRGVRDEFVDALKESGADILKGVQGNVDGFLRTVAPDAIGAALTGSALTDDIDVPDGHYAEETMRITVVPNRNAIMLAIGFGVAAANGDEAVATAVHGGDHFI